MPETDQTRLNIVNKAGYLLQLRVAHVVENLRSDMAYSRWNILAEEHRWLDVATGTEAFIDLVIGEGRIRLVIECKKFGAGGEWLFLLPEYDQLTSRTRCLVGYPPSDGTGAAAWIDVNASPESGVAAYCIVRGQGDESRSLLERPAGMLLRSVEALCLAEKALPTSAAGRLFYFPVIVTNAELYQCRFKPSGIDLATGQLPDGEASFRQVSFIRFRKNLSSEIQHTQTSGDLAEANRLADRSVLVVNASYLANFLRRWEV